MADDTNTHTMEKIYCMPCMGNDNHNTQLLAELMNAKNQGTDAATMAALFGRNNNQDAWNNPFIWLIWLAWMGGGNGFFGNRADVAQNADLSRQMQTMQGTITDNHNNDLALAAINGNTNAINELAQTMNSDYNTMSQAVNNVKSAIDQVSGQIGYSSESIKNAIALGDSNIISKMQDCCCQQKTMIQQMGYENQLATERQTNVLGGQIADFRSADQLQTCQQTNTLNNAINETRQAVVNGFANLGYQNSQNTAAIINASNQNTQRILDQMCSNTTQALRDSIAEKDRQLQTANIIAGLKASGCSCGCGC